MKKIVVGLILFTFMMLTQVAEACPNGWCERCSFGFCGCVPDVACRVLPQSVLPGSLGLPEGVITQPRLRISTPEKTVADVTSTVVKAFEDTSAEAERVGKQLDSAGRALVKYSENVPQGLIDAAKEADQRVREGKVVDALWHAGLAPIRVNEKSASEAVLESDYLRAIGQVAANAYGGPTGSAAYAAWIAYHQSGGNASVALRVGILTGASAYASGAAGTIDNVAQRAIVVGAIGGLTVAAAGGNQDAIKKAFLDAGAMVVIQDGYRTFTGHELDGTSSKGSAYCMTATAQNCTKLPEGAITGVDEKGNFLVDMRKVDPKIPAVGLKDHTALFNEGNPAMTLTSRIPGMQAMALFHDQWAISWDMGALTTPATIIPAIVLTYTGLGAPYYDLIVQTAVDEALNKGKDGCCNIPISTTKDEPVFYRVQESYIQLSNGRLMTSVILEQKPKDAPSWCTGKNHILFTAQPVKNSLSSVPLPLRRQCGEIRNNDIKPVYPKDWDWACRVLELKPNGWEVMASSLEDRNACEKTLKKLVKNKKNSATWYKGTSKT